MYLARFDLGTDEWVQAAATIENAGGPDAYASGHWDLLGDQLSAAARIPETTIVRRITIDPRRRLRQTIAVTAAAPHERDVRAIVAHLTRIERMGGGVLSLPPSREERDACMERLGEFRLCVTPGSFSAAGVPLACNFRIGDALDLLFMDACVAGHALTYQLHVRAIEVSADVVRAARKSMLALRDLRGVRPALIEWQEDLARMLGHAAALCEEYLVVESAEATRSIEHLLADRFRAQFGPLGFPPPAFRFERGAYQDPLVIGVHSHDLDPFSPVALCGVAEPPHARDRLLAWRPSPRLNVLIAGPVLLDDGGDDREAPRETAAPRPAADCGRAAFVSYKRQDLDRIVPLMRLLEELNVPLWYDRGIPGGAEWDTVIEGQLSAARFVLLCTSQAAIESKYVRREVKFADALNIPILPVLLEPVSLAHGMGMLLTQYQMLDARESDFVARLRAAVARL